MTTRATRLMTAAAILALVAAALPLTAVAGGYALGPPRYAAAITGEAQLLEVFAAGLAGDAFGYDAHEMLFYAREMAMPTEDIVPTFYIAHLSGKSFLNVASPRVGGASWADIADDLGVTAEALNEMALPKEFEAADPKDVPDRAYEDIFVGSAVSYVFDIHPDEVFWYYREGWSAIDVMAAAQLADRARRPMGAYLEGSPRRVNWFDVARRASASFTQIARDAGRCRDNLTPVMGDSPQRGDLETLYAMELVVDHWGMPIDTVQRARARYLYSPSELVICFYLADLSGRPYVEVGELYAKGHWRNWGPTIADLRIPAARFSRLPIWTHGRVDFGAVDNETLHNALLSAALSAGSKLHADFLYTHFDPYFGPSEAILYVAVYDRYDMPFDDYYYHCRHGHPGRWYPHFGQDYGEFRRSLDRIGHRRVGVVIGDREPSRRPPVYTPPPTFTPPRPPQQPPRRHHEQGGQHSEMGTDQPAFIIGGPKWSERDYFKEPPSTQRNAGHGIQAYHTNGVPPSGTHTQAKPTIAPQPRQSGARVTPRPDPPKVTLPPGTKFWGVPQNQPAKASPKPPAARQATRPPVTHQPRTKVEPRPSSGARTQSPPKVTLTPAWRSQQTPKPTVSKPAPKVAPAPRKSVPTAIPFWGAPRKTATAPAPKTSPQPTKPHRQTSRFSQTSRPSVIAKPAPKPSPSVTPQPRAKVAPAPRPASKPAFSLPKGTPFWKPATTPASKPRPTVKATSTKPAARARSPFARLRGKKR